MKKTKSYYLSQVVIDEIHLKAVGDGRTDSDWLDRYLYNLFKSNTSTPIKTKVTNFGFKGRFLSLGVDKQVLSDWLATRRKKKASNTETAFNSLIKQIKKSGLPIPVAIEIAAGSGWAGFKAEWVNASNNSNQPYSNSFMNEVELK